MSIKNKNKPSLVTRVLAVVVALLLALVIVFNHGAHRH